MSENTSSVERQMTTGDANESDFANARSPTIEERDQSIDTDSDEEDEDDEPDATDWLLYRDRAEWADVTPIEQDDGPYTVVRIKYSDLFKDAYDYFRAILKSGEKSERALELVTSCCRLNPSNYTAWTVRRDILQSLQYDLKKEMKFIEEMIHKQPKNYQVWHHRRWLAMELDDGSDEPRLTSSLLKVDHKNYHAWQHRQYCVQRWSLWDEELDFSMRLISEDVRNNSAWNHRFVVLKATGCLSDHEKLEKEVQYAIEKIRLAPSNESAWSFLRGLLKYAQVSDEDQENCTTKFTGHLCDHSAVNLMVNELIIAGLRQAQLMSFKLDSAVDQLKKDRDLNESNGIDMMRYEELATMCDDLATKYDTIRCNYWNYYSKKLAVDFGIL